MKLYLVRHGAVIPPAPDAFYGDMDVALSELGMEEARLAGEYLAKVQLSAIYASPLQRAKYGAEQVQRHHPLNIEFDSRLKEINRGRWAGKTAAEINELWPTDLACCKNDLESWNENGGESLGELRNRVIEAKNMLLSKHFGENVAIVAHMMPIKALLAEALGLELSQWLQLRLPTASVSLLEYQEVGLAKVLLQGLKPSA